MTMSRFLRQDYFWHHVLAYYSVLKNLSFLLIFLARSFILLRGLGPSFLLFVYVFFFSLTLILLAVQLRDGRFCTAALDSRLPLPHRLIVFDRVDSVYSETHRSNSARANNIRKIHKFLNYPKQTATLRNAG